ncbi:GNAT family N-acetyltransferase [Paenibacillus sp. LHD-117]|uniref:GNAT family N-acetyltransferase n=1 Tax=Paenibacillus sp. LHD-117 TaxID=3071412 RepID=UPI0027DF9A97|nr:GNAT family N-acetyltransferase [Paenibacillus sp. LHD-117]MDQ6422268.1 GNAT family N-acetyltransferase [Paenibacillus sp. LHD-117]
MLKKRDLHECHSLFNLMMDPAVSPYVRFECQSYEEYLFITKKLIVDEEQKTCISRTILNEMGHPIGTIDLYDIVNQTGFLATWIGTPYFGKGYNRRAKESFLTELFIEHQIDTVFMKIRKQNARSKKAVEKLPYAILANDINQQVYKSINHAQLIYDLYQVERLTFLESCKAIQHGVAT